MRPLLMTVVLLLASAASAATPQQTYDAANGLWQAQIPLENQAWANYYQAPTITAYWEAMRHSETRGEAWWIKNCGPTIYAQEQADAIVVHWWQMRQNAFMEWIEEDDPAIKQIIFTEYAAYNYTYQKLNAIPR